MSFSVNTNIASLRAQEFLRVNGEFQTKTIGRVTSGLRILSSGDDAAGLAIANGFRSDQAVLTQGIRNANDGLSQLQIIDGGLNNISKLLDRARTLATQSATATFTGSRTVLNNEFQSVLTEIDRQSQAIGLNLGGEFAKNLSVFIGGGKTSGATSAITNGSVGVDLRSSTVDSASLNLRGNRAQGIDVTNLAAVLANTENTSSQAVAGQSRFVFKGAGFGSGVTVTVDTTSSPNAAELVARINSAITAAGEVGTSESTAFANAKIRASVVTNSTGDQSIVFDSAGAAFQIDGGDRLANAVLNGFEYNPIARGANTAAFVDTDQSTATDDNITFSFSGGAPVTVTLSGLADANNVSKGEIVRQLNANSDFSANAVAYLDANRVVVKSKTNSSTATITVTNGTLAQSLGLTTSADVTYAAQASATGAALTTTVQAGDRTSNQARLVGGATSFNFTVNDGTTDQFRITVGATSAVVDLANATYTSADEIATALNTALAASTPALNTLVTASAVNGRVVLTATNPNQSVAIADEGTDNTLATNIFGAAKVGTVSTGQEFATQDTIRFRISGGGLTSPVDIALDQTTIGTTTVADAIADLRTKVTSNATLAAAGITLSSDSVGNNLAFTSRSGESFSVLVTGDSLNQLGFGSFESGASPNQIEYTSITGSAYTTSFSNSGAGTATLQFSIAGAASSGNQVTVNLAGGDATRAEVAGTVTLDGDLDLAANNTFAIRVNGGTLTTVTAGAADDLTNAAVLTNINTAINPLGAEAFINASGQIVFRTTGSAGIGAGASIEISAVGSAVATELGITAGTTRGTNATADNVVDQLNDAIQGDAELRAAGLRAVNNAGTLTIQSDNGSFFRLNAFASGSNTANIGFGTLGSSFVNGPVSTGPAQVANVVNSGGALATSFLTFNAITSGADDQSVVISTTDANGAAQSATVTLRNDATARTGRSIDDAVAAINSALQSSSSDAIKSIVAVKDRSGATEGIRFLNAGTARPFSVQASTTLNGGGFSTSGGNLFSSSALTGGANLAIDSQSQAEAAVTALATAVSKLGDAQAVVGRGQNQFNFAVNLASSQLTNIAASESRIRDADLAAEAANLTKAQIVLQAGVAALAQANSAPQAVLALLRG